MNESLVIIRQHCEVIFQAIERIEATIHLLPEADRKSIQRAIQMNNVSLDSRVVVTPDPNSMMNPYFHDVESKPSEDIEIDDAESYHVSCGEKNEQNKEESHNIDDFISEASSAYDSFPLLEGLNHLERDESHYDQGEVDTSFVNTDSKSLMMEESDGVDSNALMNTTKVPTNRIIPSEPSTNTIIPSETSTNMCIPFEPLTNMSNTSEPSTNMIIPSEPSTNIIIPSEPLTNICIPSEAPTNMSIHAETTRNVITPSEPSTNICIPSEAPTNMSIHAETTRNAITPSEPSTNICIPSEAPTNMSIHAETTRNVITPSEPSTNMIIHSEPSTYMSIPSESSPNMSIPSDVSPNMSITSNQPYVNFDLMMQEEEGTIDNAYLGGKETDYYYDDDDDVCPPLVKKARLSIKPKRRVIRVYKSPKKWRRLILNHRLKSIFINGK